MLVMCYDTRNRPREGDGGRFAESIPLSSPSSPSASCPNISEFSTILFRNLALAIIASSTSCNFVLYPRSSSRARSPRGSVLKSLRRLWFAESCNQLSASRPHQLIFFSPSIVHIVWTLSLHFGSELVLLQFLALKTSIDFEGNRFICCEQTNFRLSTQPW